MYVLNDANIHRCMHTEIHAYTQREKHAYTPRTVAGVRVRAVHGEGAAAARDAEEHGHEARDVLPHYIHIQREDGYGHCYG